MSENVETILRSLEGMAGQDLVAVEELLAADCVIVDHDIPDALPYRGKEQFLEYVALWDSAWKDWTISDWSVREAPDGRLMAEFTLTVTGLGSGTTLSRRDLCIYRVKGGLIHRWEYFNESQKTAALEAAGVSD